jgi:hypothetical protein
VTTNFVAWSSACLMRHKELSLPDRRPQHQDLIVRTPTDVTACCHRCCHVSARATASVSGQNSCVGVQLARRASSPDQHPESAFLGPTWRISSATTPDAPAAEAGGYRLCDGQPYARRIEFRGCRALDMSRISAGTRRGRWEIGATNLPGKRASGRLLQPLVSWLTPLLQG